MRHLHILHRSIPPHSGNVFRTQSLHNGQRKLGRETHHLTSLKQTDMLLEAIARGLQEVASKVGGRHVLLTDQELGITVLFDNHWAPVELLQRVLRTERHRASLRARPQADGLNGRASIAVAEFRSVYWGKAR